MKQLAKVNHEIFSEVYEGTNGARRVCCILDANCIRYMVYQGGKLMSRREYSSSQAQECYTNAVKALNR